MNTGINKNVSGNSAQRENTVVLDQTGGSRGHVTVGLDNTCIRQESVSPKTIPEQVPESEDKHTALSLDRHWSVKFNVQNGM